MCTKLVLNRSRYDSSKQSLYDLHWLPIKARINFKMLTYMYNCSVGNAPKYLCELKLLKFHNKHYDHLNRLLGAMKFRIIRKRLSVTEVLVLLDRGFGT